MSIQAGRAPCELNSWGAAHGPLWDAIRAKGRRVEVIAVGAELDMVLRADRMLQLWAAAEPGKVATGLTVKQEISAIRETLHTDNRDIEFMSTVRRDASEAVEAVQGTSWNNFPKRRRFAKGVSIDDYSTYRATRFSEPV